jgi:hypothetical protein
MHKTVWTSQLLWGVLFSVTGFGKILGYKPKVWDRTLLQATWFSAVPQCRFVFIEIRELVRGVLILAAIFHTARAEYDFLPINLGLGGLRSSPMGGCW